MLTEPVLGFGPGSEPLIEQVAGTTVLPAPDDLRPMADGDQLTVAGIDLEVIHAPGHTPGCVCFAFDAEKILVAGDTLFQGSIGRTDLPGGSAKRIRESLAKLMTFDDAWRVLPGHGAATTIGAERRGNPFIAGARAGHVI